MAIKLRSGREIELLKQAGRIVADVLLQLKQEIKPGISTKELDDIAIAITEQAKATALFKGVESPYAKMPFPGAICSSINEQIVHGIPSPKTKLREGDIISIDYGVKQNGYCGDAAFSLGVGQVDAKKQQLMDVTERLLDIAIEKMKPGVKWSEIASEMESTAKNAGFSVVTEYVGHGIGTEMHEDPKVPNFVSRELLRNDIYLKEGMVLAVEPMVNMGSERSRILKDGWTVVTRDGKPSAHFEHTLAVTAHGCDVLTSK